MANKRVRTKRSPANKYNFENQQSHDIRMLNKKKVNKFNERQHEKPNDCAELYMKQNEWNWW